jgi:ribonuclease P protein component
MLWIKPMGELAGKISWNTMRIRQQREFQRLFRSGKKGQSGPLNVHVHPTCSISSRMGLAVGRRVGGAVRRNRVKRLLRTTFRSLHNDWPETLDVIVVVHPHDSATLECYRLWMHEAIQTAMRTPENSA